MFKAIKEFLFGKQVEVKVETKPAPARVRAISVPQVKGVATPTGNKISKTRKAKSNKPKAKKVSK